MVVVLECLSELLVRLVLGFQNAWDSVLETLGRHSLGHAPVQDSAFLTLKGARVSGLAT
jgi:hypothetical protein